MGVHENDIVKKVKRIHIALDQRRRQNISEVDLTSSQAYILAYISSTDKAVYPSDIGKYFGLKHPTVSGILSRLEAKGFIQYETDDDHRRKRIVLTNRAKMCREKMEQKIDQNERALTDGMNAEEVKILCSLLDRVLFNVEKLNHSSEVNL